MASGAIPLVSPGRLDGVLRQSFTSTHSVALSSYRLKPRFRLGQLSDACCDDFHDAAAALAWDRGLVELLPWEMRHTVKQVPQQLDQRLAVAVQKPIIARPAEPFGQDVLEQQPKKLRARQGAGFDLAGVLGVTKGHLAVLTAENILLLQHPAIEVLAQIGQCLVATANVLAVDDPVRRYGGAHRQTLVLERLKPLGTEHLGQIAFMEEVDPVLAPPQPVFRIQRSRRNDEMDMRMKVQLS